MKEKILIADDELLIRDLLSDILEDNGYEVRTACNGAEALDILKTDTDIQLAVLDIMMPEMDGMQVLEKIRETRMIPVIFLTALGDAENEISSFMKGAADYIAKPFHKGVLLARIQNVLGKRGSGQVDTCEEKQQVSNLEIRRNSCQVLVNGKETNLTLKEYQLLLYLVDNRNIVLTRDQILEHIWGYDYEGESRTIDTHIKMLRNDLGACGKYIQTVRGIGYVFRLEENL